MRKKITFLLALFWAATTAMMAQYPSVGIIGSATTAGWNNADINMVTNDGVNYTLNGITLTTAYLKFRQDDNWTYNWGANSWPSGTGVQNGADVPTQAGTWNVTFNRTTGAYSFVATPDRIAILGDATLYGWVGNDRDMETADGITYTLSNVGITSGGLKFRQNDDWNYNWGGTGWPSGTATFNEYGVNVPCTPGVYDITFNKQTLAYSFTFKYDLVGIRGAATEADAYGEADIPMSTSDGVNYTLDFLTLTANNAQFRLNDNWPYTWAGTQWPSGTATANSTSGVPCQPGVYSVTFNRQTLAYSFTYLYPTVGIRGYATSVGWDGAQDIVMNTIDGVHYTVNNVTLAGGALKFRYDNAWDNNYGGYSWPSGTGVFNQNGVDIPSQPGVYNITFNRTTKEYAFYYAYPAYGFRGSGTSVGWGGGVDVLLSTADGVHYAASNITMLDGGVKFRRDNGWTYQWGGTQWPAGTASVGVDGVDIPSQAGTYDVEFNAQTLSYEFTLSAGCFEWTGAISNDWHEAGNWCGGKIPTVYESITVPDTANDPVINGGTAETFNLTIANGATVTVGSQSSLLVDNKLTVAGSGRLIMQQNSALVQNKDVSTNSNIGLADITRDSAPIFRLDYTLWSSPVAGETLGDFSPETLPNRFYHYNPATDSYTVISDPQNTAFEDGEGYLIRVSNTHPAYEEGGEGMPWTGTFVGVPNNGYIDVAVIPFSDPAGTDNDVNGYNAVGNPYPSAINLADFFEANQNNLAENSPIYFWRKKNDSGSSSYCSLTLAGYNANSANGWGDSSNGVFDDPDESDNWVINPAQGFIVKATGTTVAFRNSMRRTVTNGQFFRNAQNGGSEKSRLWLNLTSAAGAFAQTTIAYAPQATTGIDYGWDGAALTDGDVAIYSLAGESKLGIQARPAFDAADEVPIEYKITTAGQYSISLDHFDGVFAEGQEIYLRDNVLGVTQNLQTPYLFTADAGTTAGRFDVVYADALGTDKPDLNTDSIIVYKQGNAINISTGYIDIKSVAIYDLRGRLLYSADNINAAETAIATLQAQDEMLIVEIATIEGMNTVKKIIF